ncbi:unnamed protein product [Rotaria sordida]|uniref:SUEL-type lectin domain-containing protein n=1 Tax=Rotaria sordida TaxID=392033 RepID=A0A818VJE8_9BILA|nr:unnamed protein product [Rotaria sordida]
MLIKIILFFFIFQISYTYKANPTSWLCIDSTNQLSNTFPSCLPGYVIDIEHVYYESTNDNSCNGITLCRIENKNTVLFACNRKRTCHIDINTLNFHINSTCSTTKRLYIEYRCLPIIQEQKDYLCESSTSRRIRVGDINLSCERNYRLHITKALIGISLKSSQDEINNKNRFKCNKDTQTTCIYNIPNAYYDVCNSQLKDGNDDQCKIRYNERPTLKDCEYGMTSNFSMVEYLCIPGNGIIEDLPRFDICSTEISELISIDRGLLHSPKYPQALDQYLSCKKQLFVPRESRLRLFMLEKSLEYSHELNINLLNTVRTLVRNELVDINITNQNNDELVQFELKTNHVGGGQFLLYFQIDSRLSEYAPFILEPQKHTNVDDQRGKTLLKRDWRIIIGCAIGLLFVLILIAIIFIVHRIVKHRQIRARRYLKSEDDHRQRLNTPTISPTHHHHHGKDLQIEQPYLTSSSPTILPSSSLIVNNHNRPNSASSTTSSIIIHQMNDGQSDRESLIKPINQIQSRTNVTNTDIDNFYEEIKEQQQQTALALGKNNNDIKGDILNPYLEAKSFEQKKNLFQGNKSSQPIRDHHESEQRYQRPSSSTNMESSNVVNEEIKHSRKPLPKIPPQRMDLKHSEANAP